MVRSEQWWRRLLAIQQRSGMTVRECCQVAGVHVSSFYRWQKLLAASKSPSDAASLRKSVLTPVDDGDHAGPSSGFVPVKIRQNRLRAVAAERSAAENFIVGCGGLRVELPNCVVIRSVLLVFGLVVTRLSGQLRKNIRHRGRCWERY
jgi:hypothetical protein